MGRPCTLPPLLPFLFLASLPFSFLAWSVRSSRKNCASRPESSQPKINNVLFYFPPASLSSLSSFIPPTPLPSSSCCRHYWLYSVSFDSQSLRLFHPSKVALKHPSHTHTVRVGDTQNIVGLARNLPLYLGLSICKR